MLQFRRYHPNSVIFPEYLRLERRFYKNRSHLKGVDALDDSDKAGYELDTVFYDLFFGGGGDRLIAIGPPPLNFSSEIRLIKIYTDDCKVNLVKKVTFIERDRICFFHFSLNQVLNINEPCSLHLEFPCGHQATCELKPQNCDPVQLQITTLQKNNPVSWISDWITYFTKQGAQRFILYDNGSDNFTEIEHALTYLNLDIEVILISWPFNYGPIRSNYNKFCQAGQNNHANQLFHQTQWCGHFDLDEYPVPQNRESIVDILARQNRFIGVLRLDSYWVRKINSNQAKSSLSDFSAMDFKVRDKTLRGTGHKYFIRQAAYKEAKTHNGLVKFGFIRKLAKPSDFVFLHFLGLTTNWKPYIDRLEEEQFDSNKHLVDQGLESYFKRHKILETSRASGV